MVNFLKKLLISKKTYLALGMVIVSGALLLLLLDAIIMPAYTNYDEGVTVPDVSHLSFEEADSLLTSYGLRFEVADRRSNSTFPANYIIDQTPSPARIVKPHRKIYLTVNTVNTPTVEVPKVVNLSLRNAKLQLQNYGLKVGTISYESSRFKNTILRQSVEPGAIVEKGNKIGLAVSDGLGEQMVKVPEIIGLRLSEAQQRLREAGLRIGEFQFQPTKQVPPNTILDYEPKKEEIMEGQTLKLIVSERFKVEEERESGAIQVDTTYVDTTNVDTSNVEEADTTQQNN